MRFALKSALVLLGVSVIPAMAAEPASLLSTSCDAFRNLGWPRVGALARFALYGTLLRGEPESAEDHIRNVDVDGDDVEDEIVLGCSGSVDMPADPCILLIKLSGGGSIQFEGWRLSLIRFNGRIFATTYPLDAKGRKDRAKIYAVGPKTVQLACSQ